MSKSILSPATSWKMDPHIWSQLPEELLEHILCFLPVMNVFNLASKYKRLNSLIFKPSFISRYYSVSRSSASSSFLLLAHPYFDQHFLLYDFVLGTWTELSFSIEPCIPSSSLQTTSNGLQCFSIPNSSSFLVCNLLCKSSWVVEFPTLQSSFDLLTLVSIREGFKIFIISSGPSLNFAFLYDSRSRSWSQFEGFGRGENYYQPGVCRNDYLYFTTTTLGSPSVVCFDMESGKWRSVSGELPRELTFARLVGDGEGRLYMIGGVGRNGISRCLRLWELGAGENWVEMETLPDMMYRKLVSVWYHNYEHVYCFWHQGLICIGCYTWPEILYYKVARRTWHWLPKCPSLPDNWRCGFKWFSFVPELCASV
ncbi:hypothetical protein Droror1_Dr00013699 [Drosera rotundifolia]